MSRVHEILNRRGRNILSGVRAAVDQVSIGHIAPFYISGEGTIMSSENEDRKPTPPDIPDTKKTETKPTSRP